MTDQAHYFKLGLFLLIGTLFLVAVVLVLGAGQFFTRSLTLETYFDESINGLEVGSPVKYRGVRVGSVARIGFVSEEYTSLTTSDVRYVYVECRLDQGPLKDIEENYLLEKLPLELDKGLRVRPTSLGLTGQLFLEIDYLNPAANIPLPIDWKPRHLYVPSSPSTMSRVEAAISTISNNLESINRADVTRIMENLRGVTESLRTILSSKEGAAIPGLITANLDQSRQLLTRVNQVLSHKPVEDLIPEATRTLAGVRRVVEAAEPDLVGTMREMHGAAESLNRVGERLAEYLEGPEGEKGLTSASSTLRNVQNATAELSQSAVRLHEFLDRVNALTAEQQGNIQSVLESARVVIDNLRDLSGEAKRYPSAVIFGSPPGPVVPARGK